MDDNNAQDTLSRWYGRHRNCGHLGSGPSGAQPYGPGMMGGCGMMRGYGYGPGMMHGPDGDYSDYDSRYYRGDRYYGARRGWYWHHHRHYGRYGHHCCGW